MKTLFHLDKCFKFGISWDKIQSYNAVTRVFLIHFACFVISVAITERGWRRLQRRWKQVRGQSLL
jgi:hypothetical protein